MLPSPPLLLSPSLPPINKNMLSNNYFLKIKKILSHAKKYNQLIYIVAWGWGGWGGEGWVVTGRDNTKQHFTFGMREAETGGY